MRSERSEGPNPSHVLGGCCDAFMDGDLVLGHLDHASLLVGLAVVTHVG